MNWINTIKSTAKNFFWELSHTLINYLFGLTIKGDLKINPNCYIFLTARKNRLILNTEYVRYSNKEQFDYLECNKIKVHLNKSSCPTVKIDSIEVSPKIEYLFNNNSTIKFLPWNNRSYSTLSSLTRLENILSYFFTNCNAIIKKLTVNINNYKLDLMNIKVTKNKNEIIINIKTIRIIHLNVYIGKLNNFKLTYYLDENRISSFIDNMQINIIEKIIKNNAIEDLIKILDKIPKSEEKMNIKLLIANTNVLIEVHNTLRLISRNLNLERDRINIPYLNLKVWKKDILWANNIFIPLDTYQHTIESMRLRLFSSTCDKIYKTLIIFKKRFYTKKKTRRKKLKCKKNSYKDKELISNYFSKNEDDLSNSLISSTHSIATCSDTSTDFEYEYYEGFLRPEKDIKLMINEAEISFEPNNGKFHFYDFSYNTNSNEVTINTKRWLFHKDNLRLLDKINMNNSDNFSVTIGDNSLKIYPHKVYLNLDIEAYSQCFSILIKNIGRLCEIWKNNNTNQINYVFEKVYFGSFYCVFSYSKSRFSIENLIDGNLIEILNIIGMNDLELLLEDINILYPKDWSYISKIVLNKYLTSLRDRNLKNVINKTPISNLKGILSAKTNLTYFANKIKNTIS